MSLAETPTVSSSSRSKHARPAGFRSVLLPLVILLVATSACASSGKGAARGPQGKDLNITPAELQIKVRSLADPFSGAIEEVVHHLWKADDSTEWRRRLLLWQINTINALQRAVFQPVPLAALYDTWTLVEQIRIYVESGPGSEDSEENRRLVLETVDGMEAALMKIAIEAGGDEGASEALRLVREWAERNPIDRFVVRTSPESELSRWTARGNMGAMATVKSLGASLDDVMARLDLYAEYIPKQASWHAQLIAEEYVGPQQTKGLFEDFSKTATAFDRIALSLEGVPQLVAEERGIVLRTIETEREHVLNDLLTKTAEIQRFVEAQRIDFMEHQFRIEREAIFEAIANERAIIIAEAKQERADTMAEVDELAEQIIERSSVKIVDHFFMRALQLLAIGLVGLGLIAVVVALIWKRK